MAKRIEKHPCYSEEAHGRYARIHLPVAPLCNVGCRYCQRVLDKSTNRPGAAAAILTPPQALVRVSEARAEYPLTVVGIAGPGDPLANEETYTTFELVDERYPELMKCLSTNGLLLPGAIDRLTRLKVATVTVTVNAIEPETATAIYDFVVVDGQRLIGLEGARLLMERQREGVAKAAAAGFDVKINTVLIPGVNATEIAGIAELYSSLGASIMNFIPLIPVHRFAGSPRPSCAELKTARETAEKHIKQFRACKQCRADAVGVPGKEKKRKEAGTEYFHA